MLRYLAIGVVSIALFFPAYWILHSLFGANLGAAIAVLLMYIGFPALMLRLWKVYPPIFAVPVEPNEPVMAQCTERSHREIGRFKSGMTRGQEEAFVKYSVATEDGGVEHIWGVAHALDETHVTTSILNEPIGQLSDSTQLYQRSKVPIAELEDWMLIDKDGRIEGGYSHLGLAKIYHRIHGKVPKKYLKDLESFVDIDPSEYDQLHRRTRE